MGHGHSESAVVCSVRRLHADVDAQSDVNSISSPTLVIDWNRDDVDARVRAQPQRSLL